MECFYDPTIYYDRRGEETRQEFENDFADYSDSELYMVFDSIQDWWLQKMSEHKEETPTN